MRSKNKFLDIAGLVLRILVCVICAVLVLFIIVNVLNKLHYSIMVFNVSGEVSVDRKDKELSAVEGMHLKNKDKVAVSDDSWTRLCLDDSKYTYLDSGTVVSISHPAITKKYLIMNLEKGQAIVEVRKKLKEKNSFDVVTPNTSFGIRGTVIAVKCEQNENGNMETCAYVLEGKGVLECSYIDENGDVKTNEITLSAGEGWKFETNEDNELTESGLGTSCDAGEFDFENIDVHSLQGADNNDLVLTIDGFTEEYFSETADYVTLFGKQYEYEMIYDMSLLYDVYPDRESDQEGSFAYYFWTKKHDFFAIIRNAFLRMMFRMFGGK